MEAEVSSRIEQLGIGLAAIALEEAFVGAREDVPIDVAQIVALGVSAVLGEFLGEAEIGRAVEARRRSHRPRSWRRGRGRRWRREWRGLGSAGAFRGFLYQSVGPGFTAETRRRGG